MENKLKLFIYALPLLLWWVWWAVSDYRWSGIETGKYTSQGWDLIDSRNNVASFDSPWTLFKAPTSTLIFTNSKNATKLDSQVVQAEMLWVVYQDFSKTITRKNTSIFDCSNMRWAQLDGFVTSLDQIHQSDWMQFTIEESVPRDTIQKACKHYSNL